MVSDFSELARLWVEIYGEEIARLPRAKLVEIANQCISADMVSHNGSVRPEEEMHIAAALKVALDEYACARARAPLSP